MSVLIWHDSRTLLPFRPFGTVSWAMWEQSQFQAIMRAICDAAISHGSYRDHYVMSRWTWMKQRERILALCALAGIVVLEVDSDGITLYGTRL